MPENEKFYKNLLTPCNKLLIKRVVTANLELLNKISRDRGNNVNIIRK